MLALACFDPRTLARLRSLLVFAVVAAAATCTKEYITNVTPPFTVTVTPTSSAILPGQTVGATITVSASTITIDYLKITTTGVLASSESLAVNASGSYTVTRTYRAPLGAGTGSLNILGTAAAGGATATGETRIAVADTAPPVASLTVTPSGVVQPGDSITISLAASDNVGLSYATLRVSGAFSFTDSTDFKFATVAQRTLGLRVPHTATLRAAVTVTAKVVDVAGLTATSTGPALSVDDVSPPVVRAVLSNTRGTAGFAPGDTMRLVLTARDNYRLQYAGYAFGPPAAARDSFSSPDTTLSRTVMLVVPSAWTGTSTYTVFARDSIGHGVAILLGSFTVATRTRAPIRSVALDAAVRDVAFDVKRGLVYLSQPDSQRVAVLALASAVFQAPLRFVGQPRGIDVTLSSDSLLVALRATPYLAVVDLATGARDTIRVNGDNFLNRGPDNVRVTADGKAIVSITFDGTGYGGSIVAADLATRTYKNQLTVTEFVPVCRSGDRSTLLVLVDDSCCPIEGIVYDALNSTFLPGRGTVSRYFNVSSADFSGSRFLINETIFTTALSLIGAVAPAGYSGASVIAPDAASAFYGTTSGVSHVRLSDGAVLETFSLGASPNRLALAPDGLTLVAATSGQLSIIDLW